MIIDPICSIPTISNETSRRRAPTFTRHIARLCISSSCGWHLSEHGWPHGRVPWQGTAHPPWGTSRRKSSVERTSVMVSGWRSH
eukprot:1194844-Prorocentrum_minimum.AAC.4